VLDAPPLLLEDPAALALFGPHAAEVVRERADRLQSLRARAFRAHVLLRSRFTEDRLALAVERGVRRYVVLGAGCDTFAVRQPVWAGELQILEVDQPASQREKLDLLRDAGLTPPANVDFLALDFERETLEAGLARAGVDRSRPAFFSWLGVTMYLTEEAIDAVLRTVAAYPPGSEIVLTFAQPGEPTAEGPGEPTLADHAAAAGEPWLTYFTPEALRARLEGFGFRQVDFLTPEAASARYFAGRADGLSPPRRTSIVSALR
jgi:methyltransferase (TIGR00027 family)